MGKCQIYISYISTLSHSNFRFNIKTTKQQQQPTMAKEN